MVAADDPKASPAYLFVFDGLDAELAPVPGEQERFTLTVPIARANQLVTWFTDRPVRDAGHLSMASFVDTWTDSGDDSFTADPPNVAISFGQKTVIATMTGPRIVTAPDGDESFESTMTLVTGDALEQLTKSGEHIAAHAERARATTLPGAVTLPSVSVFVDDSDYTPKAPHAAAGLSAPSGLAANRASAAARSTSRSGPWRQSAARTTATAALPPHRRFPVVS